MEKVRTLGTKRLVCAILVCALLLTTPSLATGDERARTDGGGPASDA